MQLLKSDLFTRFPGLKLIIPHGGGAVPYHWGRYRGIAIDMKRPEPAALMGENLYFDTCVYHQPGIDLLAGVVPVDNILFASELHGAVRCKDPDTGRFFDDTRQYIEANKSLTAGDREKIYWRNALKVFTRLEARRTGMSEGYSGIRKSWDAGAGRTGRPVPHHPVANVSDCMARMDGGGAALRPMHRGRSDGRPGPDRAIPAGRQPDAAQGHRHGAARRCHCL